MMETFIVLGLCFILYEALDFFQGCIHSATPTTSDQIDAYRRQLDEQRQQQQQEQFLANLTPLLGAQFLETATSSSTTTPTASTASVISDLHQQQQQKEKQELENHSASTPALFNGSSFVGGGFRPAHQSIYEAQDLLHATSSLPRDYYYLQQQQLKNKNSSKSLLSKFSSNSDNRIFPETPVGVLGVPAGVITIQPPLFLQQQQGCGSNTSTDNNTYDCLPTFVPPSALAVDLKRAILSNSNSTSSASSQRNTFNAHQSDDEDENDAISRSNQVAAELQLNLQNRISQFNHNAYHNTVATAAAADGDSGDELSESDISSSASSVSASAGSASLSSCACVSDQEAADEREFAAGSCSSSQADFREIECERLRRKCVSVKRIYSISEKF